MKFYGLAFLLLLGYTDGQYGGNDPQCNIRAEEVLQQKQPLINQLKALDDNWDFRDSWSEFFNYAPCMNYDCEYHDYHEYMNKLRRLVQPYKVVEEILNVKLDIAGIVSAQEVKLRLIEERKREIMSRYLTSFSMIDYPFLIFDERFGDYDSLADTSRCEPCIDSIKFSSCLYNELNEIKEVLAIFEEVAVYFDQFPPILTDAQDSVKKMFTNFTVTTEQIFDFYRNNRLVKEYKRYIDDVEDRYGWYLENTIAESVNKFTKIVQDILDEVKEPINIQDTCVGNVLKDVITQIKPYLTPIAKTLPKWDFDEIVSIYVKPDNITGTDLINKFDAGFEEYRKSVFPAYQEDRSYDPYPDLYNPYSDQISSIINKGLTNLKQCPDFELLYSNSVFRCFVIKGTHGEYAQAFVMDYIDRMNSYERSTC